MRGVAGGKGPGTALVSWTFVGCLLGGLSSGTAAWPADDGRVSKTSSPRRGLEDRFTNLKRVREGARTRLGDPQCLAVLTDFESVTGIRLDKVLEAAGRTAQEQLDSLVLVSGLGRPPCGHQVRTSVAFTQIRSSEVSICLQQFTVLPHKQQEAALIHEMLHSLGLGENPPASVAITAQVLKRCAP